MVSFDELPELVAKQCFGIDPAHLNAYRSPGTSEPVLLGMPDGTDSERSIRVDVPVGVLLLQMHLEDGLPPPMASAMMFAGSSIPMDSTLAEQGVMEGSRVEVERRSVAQLTAHSHCHVVRLLLQTADAMPDTDSTDAGLLHL